MNKARITYYGWNYKGTQRFKSEVVVEGEIIKETEKQIVIKQLPSGTTTTINKYKIISFKKMKKDLSIIE